MWSAGYLVSAVLALVTSSFQGLYRHCSFIVMVVPSVMGSAVYGMAAGRVASFYSSFVFFQAAFQLTSAVRNASIAKGLKGPGGKQEVDEIFILSAVLWAACGAGVGLEAVVQGTIQATPSLSFADVLVWKALAAMLTAVSLCFAVYFLGRKLGGVK